MKQSHLVLSIVLAFLILIGWGAAIFGIGGGQDDEYRQYMELAEEYYDRGLFQKAALEYRNAVDISNSEADWAKLIKAFDSRYAESNDIYDDFVVALVDAVDAYPANSDFVLRLAELYMDDEMYVAAYSCLEEAVDAGAEDSRVKEFALSIGYSYNMYWYSYSDFKTCVNGYFSVCENEVWDFMSADGNDEEWGQYSFTGPVGENGVRVINDGVRTLLIDEDKVIQGILSFQPEDAGVYSEGFIAVKRDGKYAYYNSLGDKLFGEYDAAGTFIYGEAAVKENGKWFIIDDTGEKISDTSYEHIILNLDGTHIMNGTMMVKDGGKYYLCSSNGEKINGFVCDGLDVATEDGLIAFCRNGKWGYVDMEGTEIISPQYIEAKSFSNGLAAVYDGTKWGFINKSGTLVIDYTFAQADYFTDAGYCMVYVEDDASWQLLIRNVPQADML